MYYQLKYIKIVKIYKLKKIILNIYANLYIFYNIIVYTINNGYNSSNYNLTHFILTFYFNFLFITLF